jgi:hypothetical protein
MIAGEHATGAREASEDLVENQDGAGLAAEPGETGEPSGGRHEDALATDDRFDEDRCDPADPIAAVSAGLGGELLRHALEVAGEGQAGDVR